MKSILTILALLTFFYEITNAQIPKEKNPLNEKQVSLVPKPPEKAPDYFCTWNVQGYAGSYLTTKGMRVEDCRQGNYYSQCKRAKII